MSDVLGPAVIIANPAAGVGDGGVLQRLRAGLDAQQFDYEMIITEARGHATQLARDAVLSKNRRYVIAVGGDGTVHEVVNGLVDAEQGAAIADGLVLGVVSAGSGADFARTFGLDRPPEKLVPHLVSETSMPVDLGRVRATTPLGDVRAAVFANVAEAGFGGKVAGIAARLPRQLGPARYAAGIVVGWGGFRRVETTIVIDTTERTERVCNVVVANGQFFGGGMHVAPRALPNDGVFSVQLWGGSVTDVIRASRQLRTGAHLQRPDVRSWNSSTVTIQSQRPLIVEADGERIGVTPASFDVLPAAIAVKI
ncbi:MAG: YegS/Rv2252/BmrU family lipid kinase [Nitriliruptoraceae bacterium]